MPKFHAEGQKVFYWTYVIEAADEDVARELADVPVSGKDLSLQPVVRKVVGRKLVARHVTNVHPITDACEVRGCTQHFADALDELADNS